MNLKFGRHLNRRGQYTPQPIVSPSLDFSLLTRAPLHGLCNPGERLPGYAGTVRVIPGGAIGAGSVLAQLPTTTQIPIVTAAIGGGVADVGMMPGHFRVRIDVVGPAFGSTTDRPMGIRFARAGDFTGIGALGPGNVPRADILLAGVGTQLNDFYEADIYFPAAWFLWVTNEGALAVGNYQMVRASFTPLHLLDEGPTQF